MANTHFSGPVHSANGFVGTQIGTTGGNTAGVLDVTSAIVVIEEEGTYTLPDGVEGQILYITAGTEVDDPAGVFVNVTNGRRADATSPYAIIEGTVIGWIPFSLSGTNYGTTTGPLVFINGYWSLPHSYAD